MTYGWQKRGNNANTIMTQNLLVQKRENSSAMKYPENLLFVEANGTDSATTYSM